MGPLFRSTRRWFTSRRNETRRPRPRTRLWMQSLEERAVPAILTVTDPADSGTDTLRGRIAVAIANGEADTIIFSGVTNIILTTGDLDITGENFALKIDGDGTVTINGDVTAAASNRIFNVNVGGGNPTITFEQLTLKGGNLTSGNSGAAILVNNDPIVLDSVTISNNKTLSTGGAIGTTSAVAANVTIKGSTFSNNSAGTTGGVIHAASSITLNIESTTFDNNTAGSSGGVINTATTGTSITINKASSFSNNSSGSTGGVINTATATLNIDSTTFTSNRSNTTGGVMHIASPGTTITISKSAFNTNTSGGNGGVISNASSTTTYNISDSTFTNNRGGAGGVLRGAGTPIMNMSSCVLTGNTGTGNGGALYFVTTGSLNLSSSTITGNSSGSAGGGIRLPSGSSTITQSVITNNIAQSTGGGVDFTSGTVSITFTTVSGNSAVGVGGGINLTTGTLHFDNSTVANNITTSTSGGGGLTWSTGTINLRNSTISSNTAANGAAVGGAIRGTSSGTLNVHNSTITKNTASGAGGGGLAFTGTTSTTQPTVNIQSSIIAQNLNATHPDLYTAATTVTLSATTMYSIIGEDTGSVSIPFDATNNNGTTGFPVNAKLAKLANYGGPTQTHALQSGSPAVDKGINFVGKSVDQRGAGFPRIVDDGSIANASDGADIGAYEGVLLIPSVGSVTANNISSGGGTSYQVDVVYNDATGIDTTTIDINDLTIAGFTPVTVSFTGPATSVTATYTFTPPGGSFDAADNGTHSVTMNASQVEDIDSNAVDAGTIATFLVSIPQTITVTLNTDEDDGDVTPADISLREAIKLSNLSLGGYDTITFDAALNGTTVTLTLGELSVLDPFNMVGNGAVNTIISGNNNSRVFNFNVSAIGATTKLTGLTLRDGKATGSGGAILLNDDLLTLDSVTLTKNSASSTGGALQMTGTTLKVNNSKLTDNIAGSTGGALHTTTAGAQIEINSSTITGNSAVSSGGGVYTTVGTITVNSSVVSNNIASSAGGGITASTGTVSVTLSTFSNNVAASTGGGLRLTSTGKLFVISSTVSGNTATIGGGVYTASGTSTVEGSTIANNVATTSGGAGLNMTTGNMTIKNSTISQNTAATAGAIGGAIRGSSSGTLTIDNSTITRNSAAGNGGGLGFTSTTVIPSINLTSTIIAQNFNANHPDLYTAVVTPPQIFANYNVIGVDSGLLILNGGNNQTGSIGSELDAKLSPLGYYGGPTPTHGLLANSPALDKGSNSLTLTTDQRGSGFNRVIDEDDLTYPNTDNGTDVGAFEGILKIPSAKANAIADIVASGGTSVQVVVVYTDETGIDTTTIDTTDISVSGFLAATTVSLTGPATSVTATYTFPAPGGSFDIGDNGTYTITMNSAAVFDTDGPFDVLAGSLGTFRVAIPQTFTVTLNTDEDDGDLSAGDISLREAIKQANASGGATDDIVFDAALNGSTITLTLGAVTITDPVNILGNGATNTIISGNFASQIFNFGITGLGGMSSIYNVTLRDGKLTGAGGAISLADDALTINSCTITNNSASTTGGGISLTTGSLIAVNCTFSNNTAQTDGGGINTTSGSVNVSGSTFTNNTANSTGAAINSSSTATIFVTNCTISGNTAVTSGGGIYTTSATTTLTNTTVTGNKSNSTGSGVTASTGTINVSNSTITNNVAVSTGGGLRLSSSGKLNVTSSTVSGNTASIGGGIYTASGTSSITYSTIANNFATSTSGGGGLNLSTGKMTIQNSTISQNTATGAGAVGGAIRGSSSGTLTIDNSTITRNSAAGNGGGLGFSGTTSTTLTNVSIISSIVAQNFNAAHPDLYSAATTTTLNANVFDSIIGADSGTIFIAGSNNDTGTVGSQFDAQLAPLGNYGGTTQTHPPLPGSFALDRGSNTPSFGFDQRGSGFLRVTNSGLGLIADRGSVEGALKVPIAKVTLANVTTAGASTYVVTIVYQDDFGVDTSKIDVNDVRLSGKGYVGSVAPTLANKSGTGTSVTATYTFDAPPGPGTFDVSDNGGYTLTMQANEVYDLDSPTPNPVFSGTLGTFQVAIPTEYVVNLAADVDDLDPNNGSTSLREAVRMSNDTTGFGAGVRDRITFAPGLSAQTITLDTELTITEPVIIDGSSLALNVVIKGSTTIGSNTRIFNFNISGVGAESQFTRLTLTEGHVTGTLSGGAINLVDDILTVTSVTFTNNSVGGDGGAIFLNTGVLKVIDSVFTNNTSNSTGGAINMTTGSATISGSTLSGNTAAVSDGGGFYFTTGSLVVTNSTFSGNSTATDGGAIRMTSGSLTVTDTKITGNTSNTDGGGIYMTSGTATLTRVTVADNRTVAATGEGAGMSLTTGTLNVISSTFSGNIGASTIGGGALNFTTGKVTITNSTLSSNTAAGAGAIGGAVRGTSTGTLTIDNSTITRNSAAGAGGGGIALAGTTSTTLTTVVINSTILAQNTATAFPDIYSAGSPPLLNPVTINYSIIGLHSDPVIDLQGDNNQLHRSAASIPITGSNNTITETTTPLDALLSPLDFYGGPTKTHVLGFGSPAIDKGSNTLSLTTDQRGLQRVLNGGIGNLADVGSTEGLGPVPQATASAPTISVAGGGSQTITVVYTDDVGITTGDLGDDDIVVSGPGYPTPVAGKFAGFTGTGGNISATYTVPAPGGTFDMFDSGTYTVTMNSNAVGDGTYFVVAGAIGTYVVSIGGTLTVSTIVDEDDTDYSAGDLSLREAVRISNASKGAANTITFDPSLNGKTLTLTLNQMTLNDDLTITGPGSGLLTISGRDASRIFTISDGDNSTFDDYTLSGLKIIRGKAVTGTGGAFDIGAENVTLIDMYLAANNSFEDGGAINVERNGGKFVMLDSTIAFNNAGTGNSGGDGGGINFEGGNEVTIKNSSIANNFAADDGGGLHFLHDTASAHKVLIENTTISANTAAALSSGGGGGGINFGGTSIPMTIDIRQSTVSGNVSAGDGGGIHFYKVTTAATILNSTLAYNTAAGNGGGVNQFTDATGTIDIESTIISNNVAAFGADIQSTVGTINSKNNALGAYSVTTFNDQGGNSVGQDYQLSPLSGFGGPTQTIRPGTTIYVTDKGSNPALLSSDQRGLSRSVGGGVDIGAHELNPDNPYALATFLPVTSAGGTVYTITVTYFDDSAIDVSKLGTGDITVYGLNGFTATPTFKSVDNNTPGTPRVATYELTPPGGSWDGLDNSIYIVSMAKNEVYDTAGSPNAVYDGALGGFFVDVPVVMVVDTLADEDDGDVSPGDVSLREAIALTNAYPDPTNAITFAPSLFSGGAATLTMALGEFAITSTVSITGPGSSLLTIDGGAKSRIFNTTGGSSTSSISFAGMRLFNGGTTTGMAILMGDENVTVTDSVITGNTGTANGGAIWASAGGSLTVKTSTFSNNVGNAGAAITTSAGTSLLVEGSTFVNNSTTASNSGGAIRISGAIGPQGANIRNSTFVNNFCVLNGGAIGFGDTGTGVLNIDNCTIVGNSVNGTGGGVGINNTATNAGAVVNIRSSIVYGNLDTGVANDIGNGTTSTFNVQHSLLGTKAGAATTTITDATTEALVGLDPQLNPLANNGGPVQTMSLKATSPAIDQGFNYGGLSVDAANQPRIFDQTWKGNAAGGDGTDIGAFEAPNFPPPTATVKIDSGTGQRSMIQSITVTFSEAVTLGANPFTVERLNTSTIPAPAGVVTLSIAGSGSTYTITFNDPTFAPTVGAAKSLIDGQYKVTLNATDITSVATGLQFDGDGNGAGGDNQATNFHRLYGDVRGASTADFSGNGFTDNVDLIAFRNANGSDSTQVNYDPALDVNGDGFIDNIDLIAFRQRLGVTP